MTRNLKVLFLAAMALTAFGVLNAAGAHAAEERFHCELNPCRATLLPDGTGTTAHHVFVLKNNIGESLSFTCERLTGDALVNEKTVESITVTGLVYDNCKTVLGAATMDMNGCTYLFNSRKGGAADEATVTIECPENKSIEFTNGLCKVKVGAQGPYKGIGYHTLTETTEVVTVTAKVSGIVANPEGECGIDLTKTPITAELTTGNMIVTAESESGVMVNGWWA